MSRFKKLDKRVKKLDVHDIQLTKLSTVAAILFVITVWPAFLELVMKAHWGWYLGAAIILAWRPARKFFG